MKNNTRLKNVLVGVLVPAFVIGCSIPVWAANSRTVTVTNENAKLVINGKAVSAKDKNGKNLTPIFIDGVAYIPAQSVGDALGMTYSWNDTSKEVILSNVGKAGVGNEIGLEKAKQIALDHAGLKAASVTFFTSLLDIDDGRTEYDIEFYSGNTEYDYEIDAYTGAILNWDQEIESYTPSKQNSSSTSKDIISLEKARALAKAKVPTATIYSCKLDFDDGRQIYEGELRDGNKEYDFEIDAVTGAFLKWEVDYND